MSRTTTNAIEWVIIVAFIVLSAAFVKSCDTAIDKEIEFQDNVKASWVGSSAPCTIGGCK